MAHVMGEMEKKWGIIFFLMIISSILTIKLMIVSSMLITFSILMIDRPQKLVSPATFCLRLKGPLNLDSGLMLTDLPYKYISFTK